MTVPLLRLSAALAVVGIGLPWQASSLGTSFYPTYLPGICTTSYDGSLDCGPGVYGLGTVATVRPAVMGFGQPIRVFAVLAALLLWWAWRHRSRTTAALGLGCAMLGVVNAGFSAVSGPAVFLAAVGVVALALRREGLLGRAAAGTTVRGGPPGVGGARPGSGLLDRPSP